MVISNLIVYIFEKEKAYHLRNRFDNGNGQFMIRLNILPLLEQKGKTKYWLYKQLGMSYQNFKRMVDNKTASIKIERIETLCLLLDCTPNDLFEIQWEQNENGKETENETRAE